MVEMEVRARRWRRRVVRRREYGAAGRQGRVDRDCTAAYQRERREWERRVGCTVERR